jgi:hypothetical protein
MATTGDEKLAWREAKVLAEDLTKAAPSGVTVSVEAEVGPGHQVRIHFRGPTGHHSVCLCHSSVERVMAHADGFFEATRARAARLLGATLAEVA